MLSILEAKVNSVDYVANMTTTAGTAAAAAEVVPDVAGDAQSGGQAPADSTAAPTEAAAAPEAAAPAPEPEAASGPTYYTYKEHPSYKKFFYLKSIGIPEMALAQQMRVNDLDPSVLEHDENDLTDTVKPDDEGGGD